MSQAKITIDRVGISLFGVSQEIAEAAVSGLEGELARRIGALPLRAAAHAPVDLAEVVLGPITAPARLDSDALRSLIADALVGQLLDADARPGSFTGGELMSGFLRGALIEYSGDFLGPIPNLVVFQFNPETFARTIAIPAPPAQSPSESARPREPAQAAAPPTETFTLTAHFSAADDLGKGGAVSAIPRLFGVGPQLAALEKMVYPAGPLTGLIGAALDAIGDALGGGGETPPTRPIPRESVPRILFIWGLTRVLPVKITSLSITEQKFDFLLNPVQAEVQIGLAINNLATTSSDTIGKGALMYSQVAKDAQSILNLAKAVELAVDIIPF